MKVPGSKSWARDKERRKQTTKNLREREDIDELKKVQGIDRHRRMYPRMLRGR